jgi:dihydroflavonol-4-reductase
LRVLVTGADGLLGSNLVRELLDLDHSVRVLIQPGSGSRTLEGLALDRAGGDLLAVEENLDGAVSGCPFVLHCAGITDMWADPGLTWRVNLEGTRRVLDACLREGVVRLVFVGSASSFQFGPIDNPGDESGSFPAVYKGMAYMESKHRAMELVRDYVENRGLNAVIVNPTFMLGPYDARPSSGELIRQFVERGMKYVSKGGRNFVHARDVARAMVSSLENGTRGESYIVGGENLGYLDFFSIVAEEEGFEPPRRVLPNALVTAGGAAGSIVKKISGRDVALDLKMARIACLGTYYSSAKAERELGLEHTPVKVAVEESLRSLKEYGHIR